MKKKKKIQLYLENPFPVSLLIYLHFLQQHQGPATRPRPDDAFLSLKPEEAVDPVALFARQLLVDKGRLGGAPADFPAREPEGHRLVHCVPATSGHHRPREVEMQGSDVGPQAALLPEGDVEELGHWNVAPRLDRGYRGPRQFPRAVDVGGGQRVGGRGGVAAREEVGERSEQEVAVDFLLREFWFLDFSQGRDFSLSLEEENKWRSTFLPLSSPPRPSAPWPWRRRRPRPGRCRARPARRRGARTRARRARPRARLEGRER